MSENRLLRKYTAGVSLFGALVLAYALTTMRVSELTVGFALTLLITVFIAPRLNITLPHAGLTLSFSDAVIFLAFIFHGGPAAIVLSSLEVFASFFYLRRRGVAVRWKMIPFNVAIAAIATGASVIVVTKLLPLSSYQPAANGLGEVFTRLFVLALTQFVFTSSLTAAYYAFANSTTITESWKTNGVPLSVTHIGGALFAGLIFFVWTTRDFVVAASCSLAGLLIYLNYKQVMTRMSDSIEQAREAERELVDTERKKNKELQEVADDLAKSLFKGEQMLLELSKSRQAFKHAALHDSLTTLPNRAYFGEMLQDMIRNGRFEGVDGNRGTASEIDECNASAFVLFLDLSRFKSINEIFGHGIGDRVLEITALRFKQVLRDGDVAARIGGDEFAILLRTAKNLDEAVEVAQRIRRRICEPISIAGNRINIGINIGLTPITPEYSAPEEVLRDADIAMHHAQSNGTGVEAFSSDLRDESLQRAQIEAELPFAIERGELHLHFQPLISLRDGALIGLEALLRWNHPKRGPISPAEFIPVAEESGLIIPMTSWILDQACGALSAWQKSSARYRDLIVSVNISGKHLSHQSLFDDIERVIDKFELEPSTLKLEITESVAMKNAEQTIESLNRLKDMGVQLSIDDFGTGYSSLSYLHQLPFDTLKVDRSFVKDVRRDGENSDVLRTIVALAKTLGMRVIAEGIETREQLSLLQSLGCEYGQGFLMSRPVSSDVIAELLAERISWLPADHFPLPAQTQRPDTFTEI